EVIAGNTRLKAAQSLGMTEVPVWWFHGTDLDATAYAIADNRTHEFAQWNDAELVKLLEHLKAEDSLDGVGYGDEDIDALVEQLRAQEEVDLDLDDDGAGEPPAVATAQRGDLWLLGDHRLLCGDSTCLPDVLRLMDGDKAALVATDPPYLVDYTGERPNDSGKDWTDSYREIDIEDADGFFRAVFANVLEVLGSHAAIYCWHAHKRCGDIQRIWRDLGILDHQQIIWVKPTPVFGRVYWHFQHEPCVMGWKKGDKPEHDGVHEHTSVWTVDWDGKARVVGNEHPCLHPEARVLTDAGWCEIRTISIGTNVLAADGQFHAVTDVSSHPYTSPDLFRIVARGGNVATLASDNHPFLVWREGSTLRGRTAWVRADELRVGDYTMTPLVEALEVDELLARDEDANGDSRTVRHEGTTHLLRLISSIDRVPYQSDVWNLSVDGCPSFQTSVGMSHNTEKPVELFTRPIRKHTNVGDIVFEPFSGSGSQIIAAERTGRRCRALEISPPFVDVAIRRWEKATGKEAVLDGDGRSFAAIAAERGPS
ncbi:MAG: DNA methyltransferase, partial [Planctomycetota bacterium]